MTVCVSVKQSLVSCLYCFQLDNQPHGIIQMMIIYKAYYNIELLVISIVLALAEICNGTSILSSLIQNTPKVFS